MNLIITNPVGVLSLSKREIIRFLSVASQTIFPPLIASALFMYIFGVAVGSRIPSVEGGLSYLEFIIPGLITLHLISSSYENTSSSLFIARWHNHIQEVLLAPLSYYEMVLGLLAGGVTRGFIVSLGVFLVSIFFTPTVIEHPLLLLYFIGAISVIFSCAGMIGALWAEDFGMLSLWNIYVIVPMVFLGGVFHPIGMLPHSLRIITKFNPMHYLINGVRFSIVGSSDMPVLMSVVFALILALGIFFWTVHLFKIGYKLRT